MERKNFKTNLHLACSPYDELRPTLNYIHFKDGYAYATNEHILIKQSLKLHGIVDPENLEGKSLHWKSYREILKYPYAEAFSNHITCIDETREVQFKYCRDIKPIDYEKIFKQFKPKETKEIGINSGYLEIIKKVFVGDRPLKLEFNGNDRAMRVTMLIDPLDQVAILMPCMIFNH